MTELKGQLPLFTWNTELISTTEQPDEECAGCCVCNPADCPPDEHPFAHHEDPDVV